MSNYSIAFYIQLENAKVTLRNADLDVGNPGVGGTQYLFLITVKNLNRMFGGKYALLLTDGDFGMDDKELPFSIVEDEADAVRYCKENRIGLITFNANILDHISKEILNENIRILIWAHNTLTWKRQCIAAKYKSIDRVVCVSKSQCDNMSDAPCAQKCTYINNIIQENFYENSTLTDYSEEKVVYVGSIMPQKGVHNLLEIWLHVEAIAPNAQLYIFGGANIWNPNIKLSRNSSADMYYERIINKKLAKLIHPENIHFMGAKGWKEIDTMIGTARVGVVNPSNYMRDETFCMSAIEMEAHGLAVVSRQRDDGLNTTIIHGETGFLEKNDEDIAARILELLQNKHLCETLGENARKYAASFVAENELVKWKKIVDSKPTSYECSSFGRKSRDGKLLQHDFMLKLRYLVESGKAFDLAIKKIIGRK